MKLLYCDVDSTEICKLEKWLLAIILLPINTRVKVKKEREETMLP